jgi:hypothetical protein
LEIVNCKLQIAKPGGRRPALQFPVFAVLFLSKQNAGWRSCGPPSGISCFRKRDATFVSSLFFLCLLSLNGHREVRCPYTSVRIDSSARNLSIVIYVLSAFQMSGIAAFEVV